MDKTIDEMMREMFLLIIKHSNAVIDIKVDK